MFSVSPTRWKDPHGRDWVSLIPQCRTHGIKEELNTYLVNEHMKGQVVAQKLDRGIHKLPPF